MERFSDADVYFSDKNSLEWITLLNSLKGPFEGQPNLKDVLWTIDLHTYVTVEPEDELNEVAQRFLSDEPLAEQELTVTFVVENLGHSDEPEYRSRPVSINGVPLSMGDAKAVVDFLGGQVEVDDVILGDEIQDLANPENQDFSDRKWIPR
jgi:hypothetical protein